MAELDGAEELELDASELFDEHQQVQQRATAALHASRRAPAASLLPAPHSRAC